MKTIASMLFFLAAVLYADLAFAVTCESDDMYQTCTYEPGEFVFDGPDDLAEFIARKELVLVIHSQTTVWPNVGGVPLGSDLWLYADYVDKSGYMVVQRPGDTLELLSVLMPHEGV